MRISVVGAGHVGLVSGACFADLGHTVIMVDNDPKRIAGHSLRSGHASEAARRGAPGHAIRRQTGHKSDAMLARYIRAGTLFEENSSARLGL